MDEESKFIMDFGIEDIHLLYDCVCRRIQNWEGAPSRHPFEQEHLSKLKSELYKAILDFKFYDES